MKKSISEMEESSNGGALFVVAYVLVIALIILIRDCQ